MRTRLSRVITRCLITAIRSSAKLVTVALTKSGGICCDSTKIVPVDWYVGGSSTAVAIAAIKTSEKTTSICTHLRLSIDR